MGFKSFAIVAGKLAKAQGIDTSKGKNAGSTLKIKSLFSPNKIKPSIASNTNFVQGQHVNVARDRSMDLYEGPGTIDRVEGDFTWIMMDEPGEFAD
ncbi:uncharacterized protein RSE6_09454 [Rhynchosporium secalis]|uniref:Uncharacterized protein n=1 Tax=Rhynchosporium secalis TaxID=38038 RepID=A0A1E1MI23_RHYSE|nr:uncharacterized protein RSE6_09454 [Rhynchosporium secalis]